jgi:hypothetical protein
MPVRKQQFPEEFLPPVRKETDLLAEMAEVLDLLPALVRRELQAAESL